MTEVETVLSNIPIAASCPVIVVPILAPKITVAACVKVIIPAFTKPMTMTVVALELCITAVAAVPTPTPSSLLFEAFLNSDFSLLLPSASKLELIIVQAIKNTPTPATRERTEVTIETVSMQSSPYQLTLRFSIA